MPLGKNIIYPVFLNIKVIQNACCYTTWEPMEQAEICF